MHFISCMFNGRKVALNDVIDIHIAVINSIESQKYVREIVYSSSRNNNYINVTKKESNSIVAVNFFYGEGWMDV